MNTFKMQCINYLLSRGWEQDIDGYEWVFQPFSISLPVSKCESLGAALNLQFEWDE